MSDRLDIPPGEYGLVRVFTVDLPLDAAQPLVEEEAQGLKQLTGAEALDPDHIDLFDMNDLSGMALADYLSEGHGIPADEIAPLRPQLDRVKGSVMVMRSSAFERIGQTLRVRRPLRWIATFGEARGDQTLEPLTSAAAQGMVPPPPAAPVQPPARNRSAAWIIAGLVAVGVIVAISIGARTP
ncbi:hypothetical protein PGB28_16130 [Primorskyibacter aestuariivivens]|uniref:hypothetical protein n=1 Tax=Primorskyibacter aestuariivivens TaxID=1888912 RepID=UPI0023013886|nr:hypothetical protein [Primorskyibacter aestuariivivens]MDA7429994.1 hypothetical protein [Primorskyibacter aestuariivivens]